MSADQISEEVRARIREQADNRCGYCLSPQHLVLGVLEIDHLVPKSRGGTDDEDNLWLAAGSATGLKQLKRRVAIRLAGDLSISSIRVDSSGENTFSGAKMGHALSVPRPAAGRRSSHFN